MMKPLQLVPRNEDGMSDAPTREHGQNGCEPECGGLNGSGHFRVVLVLHTDPSATPRWMSGLGTGTGFAIPAEA